MADHGGYLVETSKPLRFVEPSYLRKGWEGVVLSLDPDGDLHIIWPDGEDKRVNPETRELEHG